MPVRLMPGRYVQVQDRPGAQKRCEEAAPDQVRESCE